MPLGRRPVIAIIGGGYTGAAIAYHLDRLPGVSSAAAVVVVEPRATLGAGLAYGTDDPACRINVPSSRMSIDPERPQDFEDWLMETGEAAADPESLLDDGRRFPRRAAFGRYVADRLAPALAAGRIVHRRALATRVEPAGQGYRLTLSDRSALAADLVVIATSHPPPAVPRIFAEALQGDVRLVRDATRPGALDIIHPDERVLIVGTGLTMADVVASLDAAGHRGPIKAFSRRGQLSAVHPPPAMPPRGDFVSRPAPTAVALLRKIRAAIAEAEALGIPSQAVFDALRAQGQGIWQALATGERRRLVRHLRVYWDARRFRIAPQVHEVLARLRQDGQFTPLAGRAVEVKPDAGTIAVRLALKGEDRLRRFDFDRVVIATGPAHASLLDSAPFLTALSGAGLVMPDAVGLGLATDTACHAIARDGDVRETLLIAGPLARGTFGELMGLPEVTGNAVAVAGHISRWIAKGSEQANTARQRAPLTQRKDLSTMSADIFWFLPTSGDTRYLGTSDFGRAPDHDYIQQVAVAADRLGFDGLLIPTGASCLDPWVTASAVAPVTRKIKLLVALRTSLMGPAASARQAATLDRALGGRLLLNVVPGGDATELAADGVFHSHDERYAAADEFLTVWRRILEGETVDFEGRHVRVKGARNFHDAVQKPYPPLYFGGSSPAAHDLAARHVDAYLSWGEPPAAVAQKIADVRARAARLGRSVRFGVRLHVIVRETDAEAWAEADRLISKLTDEDIARAQAQYAKMDSVGQRRMAELHGGRRDRLEIAPNLWAGIGLVRGGAGTALVGDAKTVVARLEEYRAAGADTFVLSGYPHLEEAYRFAELAFPLLGKRAVTLHGQAQTGGAFDIRTTSRIAAAG